jgi:hypothetical protein
MEKQNNTQTNQMIALQTNIQPVALTVDNYLTEVSDTLRSKIEELMEDSFYLDDMLDFINEHGDDNFINYYDDYVRFGEDNSYAAVDAFIEEFGIQEVERFEDAYHGEWETPEIFAEVYCDDMGYKVPEFVVVDWEATWEQNLQYNYAFNNGFVFIKNY